MIHQYLFEGQNVVISGALGGVGWALVEHFLDRGAQVFALDRKQDNGRRLTNGQSNYVQIQVDLSRLDEVRETKRIIGLHTSSINILVNAAGVFAADVSDHSAEAVLLSLWQNNVLSATYLSTELHSFLLNAQEPLVVNIASTDGVVASGGQDCEIGVSHDNYYATTKGALITLTRSLAMKWAKDGIRVNAICPTILRSPMTADLLAIPGKEAELVKNIPLGRICEPIDVAIAVECLYQLKLTTAHVLPLDGGYLCL